MPKDPMLADKIILKNGGSVATEAGTSIIAVSAAGTATITGTEVIAPGELTLTEGHLLVGNSSGVGADVAMSGDASIASTGAVTVTGAAAAFNVGTSLTLTKEVNHSIAVTTTTTANTAGGSLSIAGGAGLGTGSGGALNLTGGASGAAGATGNGAAVNITGGASVATNGSGGSVILTGGVKVGTGIAGGVFTRALPFFKLSAPAAKTTDATLTAAELLGGLITVNQAGAGTSTLTLPLGTDLQAALPADLAVGDCFQFSVINISTVAAEDCIMAGNTGTTYVGKTTINSNDAITSPSAATFIVRTTGVGAGAGTFVCYRVSS